MDRAPVYETGCREFESLQVHYRSVAQWKRRISDKDVVVGSNPTRPIRRNEVIKHGSAPFMECSTKGDKRFSAFCARVDKRGGKSIEEIYQAAKVFEDGSTGLTWREAKGRVAVNKEEIALLYSALWDEYIEENPRLLEVLKIVDGMSDMFGQRGHVCQATELWRIKCEVN